MENTPIARITILLNHNNSTKLKYTLPVVENMHALQASQV
jgi:hypothetical protein